MSFRKSIVIPEPDYDFIQKETQILALFNVGDAVLQFYWWRDRREVIVFSGLHKQWYLQSDLVIRESIADVLGWTTVTVHPTNLALFDDQRFSHGREMPAELERVFLDCEWSDYACDNRPVSGSLVKKIYSVPVLRHDFPQPVRTHWMHVGTRTDDDSDQSSLSDDESPTHPRKWRRFESWK